MFVYSRCELKPVAPQPASPKRASAKAGPRYGSAAGVADLFRLTDKRQSRVHHISNNAPTNLADSDTALRKAGVDVAKKWLDGAAILGARSMRMNSPSALGPGIRPSAVRDEATGYPKNDALVPYLNSAIESFKEMADYGGERGVKVTIENHWGLAADPANIRIILDAVNHPFCEATPDFCNWE